MERVATHPTGRNWMPKLQNSGVQRQAANSYSEPRAAGDRYVVPFTQHDLYHFGDIDPLYIFGVL